MNYSRDDVSAAIAAMEKFRRPDDDCQAHLILWLNSWDNRGSREWQSLNRLPPTSCRAHGTH